MQDPLADRDARTTPPWARPFVVLALYALATYFLCCFHWVKKEEGGPWWAAYGSWSMFTTLATHHGDLEAEAQVGGEWRPFDLEYLFPTNWDSGPRYVRSSFRESVTRVRVLADSACDRHPDKPTRIRIYDVLWNATPGQREQPRKNERRTLRVNWDCALEATRPQGTLW